MFIFNCSHEMALAANRSNYTPPQRIRQMEHDLQLFPLVWLNNEEDESCIVWGWDLAVRERLRKAGVSMSSMPTDAELALWRSFSHRAFAADYLHDFLEKEPLLKADQWVGREMRFVRSVSDITFPSAVPFIVKQPFSSSGRGNRVGTSDNPHFIDLVEDWIAANDGVLLDRFYDKVLDFATEFEVKSDGQVLFLGYSVFDANPQGRYGGNIVDSQTALKTQILAAIPHFDLDACVRRHHQMLSQTFAHRYRGYVGIDMMVVRDEGGKRKVHPCVEMNLRMNMGIVAIRLYDKLRLLQHLVSQGATRADCLQNKKLGFLMMVPEADFSRFHFDDLYHLLRSSSRLPLSPIRDCGFQAFLQSGRLAISFS